MATISSATPTISLSRASKLTSSSSSSSYSSSTVALSSSSSLFLRGNGAGLRLVSGQRAALRGSRSSGGRKRFSCNCLFGLGVPELVVIAGVAALVFGPKKLPEVGRSIGKTFKGFQQAAKEFETELKKEPDSLAQAPSEGVEINQEEKRDATVSSTKEDS